MAQYKITPQSNQDIEDILFYTKLLWGEKQMEKYAKEIYQVLSNVALLHELGNVAESVSISIRKIPVGKHIVFYEIQGEIVWILRVLHSSMDVEDVDFE